VTAADRYATPTAFRRALTDRLKSLTKTSCPHWARARLVVLFAVSTGTARYLHMISI
jgi:hypothetical protein